MPDLDLSTAAELPLGPHLLGHGRVPADGQYVERYWLPILGPSATFALRRLGPLAASSPAENPHRVDLVALSAELGLGPVGGRNARVRTALARLVRFHLAQTCGELLLVAPAVPLLPPGAVRRLPAHLQERHALASSSL